MRSSYTTARLRFNNVGRRDQLQNTEDRPSRIRKGRLPNNKTFRRRWQMEPQVMWQDRGNTAAHGP